MKKPKAKKISTDGTRVEKPAMQFKYMAGNKAISPKFEGNVKGADHLDGMARGGYYNPEYVKQRKLNAGVIMASDKNPAFISPAKFINPQVDPATGQVLQPQPIPNRAGTPDRSLNNMQQMGSIVDPGMQSAQQADAFQKFNSIAQNMPPSPTQMKSPVNNYADPGTAQTIDNSLGAAEGVLASQRAALMADDEEDEEDGGKKKLNKDQFVKLDSGETFKKTPKKSTKIYMR